MMTKIEKLIDAATTSIISVGLLADMLREKVSQMPTESEDGFVPEVAEQYGKPSFEVPDQPKGAPVGNMLPEEKPKKRKAKSDVELPPLATAEGVIAPLREAIVPPSVEEVVLPAKAKTTIDDVRKYLDRKITKEQKIKTARVKEFINHLGGTMLDTLPEDKYDDLIEMVEKETDEIPM